MTPRLRPDSNEIGDGQRPIANARHEHLRVPIEIVLGGSCKQRPEADMHLDHCGARRGVVRRAAPFA
jgi:hypothetical protein